QRDRRHYAEPPLSTKSTIPIMSMGAPGQITTRAEAFAAAAAYEALPTLSPGPARFRHILTPLVLVIALDVRQCSLLRTCALEERIVPKKGQIFAFRLCSLSGSDKTASAHVERTRGRSRSSEPRRSPGNRLCCAKRGKRVYSSPHSRWKMADLGGGRRGLRLRL